MKGDDDMALIPRLMPDKFYLDDVFDDFMFPTRKESEFGKMRCDIYEKDGIYTLEMDIPGFSKEDVNIEIDDNDYLVITASKSSDKVDEDDKNYIRRERSYGKYQRSFYIGGIDKERIEANFENGILAISMPKIEEVKSSKKTIEIK